MKDKIITDRRLFWIIIVSSFVLVMLMSSIFVTTQVRDKELEATLIAGPTKTVELIEAHYEKGIGYVNIGRWHDARKELELVFEMDPNYKDVQAKLREIYAEIEASNSNPTSIPLSVQPQHTSLAAYNKVSTNTPSTSASMIDDHIGWAGAQSRKNQYNFYVDEDDPQHRYFLTGNIVTVGNIGSCTVTNGTVLISTSNIREKIWDWNNDNITCVEVGEFHANEGLTPELEMFIKEQLLEKATFFSMDITPLIQGNRSFTVNWRWHSGCCGVVIIGMQLEKRL